MALLIGIDVGTSSVKAIAIDDRTGRVEASASRPLTMETPRPGWAEQDASDYVSATDEALASLGKALGARAGSVRGIGLTGQMHTAVLLDENLAFVRPAILWCDTRTTAQCEAIREALGDEGLRAATGNRALEGFTLPKLLWLRENEPDSFARVAHVLMPKDLIGLHLTGEIGADVSDASGTLAFDPGARAWSDAVLDAVGVARSIFPEVHESQAIRGGLRVAVAEATGLRAGIPVVFGAADNAAGAVGLGVVRAGRAMASIGTSGVVLAATDAFVVEPAMRLHSFCHAIPGRTYLMGVMLAAGGALRWYRDVLCDGEKMAAEIRGEDAYEIITEAASTSREGAKGVVSLPYLMGERTPYADANARAALIGMSARTDKADVSRAILEGITFGLADSLGLMRDVLGDDAVTQVRVTGGGAKSPFWQRLMADIFDTEVALTTSTEGPAFGAAILAGVAAGSFTSVDEGADALVHVTSRIAPDAARAARYREVHAIYTGLYADLRERFKALAALA